MSWVEGDRDRAFPEKLRALLEGRFPPEVLHFHTSNRCNLNCRFCWRNTEKDRDYRLAGAELSDERWRELTLEACELDVPRITITGGGEPFMRLPVVLDMMEIIKSRGIQGDVVSNGTLLGTEAIERMVRYGWDSILFSLHSPTSVRSDFLRGGPDSLKQTLRNVDEINRVKAASGSRFPKITFIMVITRDNVADLADMVALGAAYRVNTVCLKIVNEPDSFIQESSATLRPDAEILRRELRRAQDRAFMCDIRMDLNFKLDDWMERREEAPGQGEGEQASQPVSSDGSPPEIGEFEPACLLPYFECVELRPLRGS